MHLFVILKELESIFFISFLFTSGYIFFFLVIVAILSSTLKYSSPHKKEPKLYFDLSFVSVFSCYLYDG